MITEFSIDDDNKDKLMRYVAHHTHLKQIWFASSYRKIKNTCTFNVMFKMLTSDRIRLRTLLSHIAHDLHSIIIDYMLSIELTCSFNYQYNNISIKFKYESDDLYTIALHDSHLDTIQPFQIYSYWTPVMPLIPFITFGDKWEDRLNILIYGMLCDTWCK